MGNYFSSNQATSELKKSERVYGWKKDNDDARDLKHNFTLSDDHHSTKEIDLRSQCPPVYDQGALGSCTANAIAAAYEFDQIKEGEQDPFTPSRLFIYYNERTMEGTIGKDAGAQIRDGIKSINSVGVCPETMWPYDIKKFNELPPEDCYKDARNHHSVEYKRVEQNLEQMKQCLMNGFPFVFGIVCYKSLESEEVTKTGVVPMPKEGEEVIGGHAIFGCGFLEDKKQFIFRNSWGESWGDQGYGYIPYDYLLNSDLASDFWTVTRVQDETDNHSVEEKELTESENESDNSNDPMSVDSDNNSDSEDGDYQPSEEEEADFDEFYENNEDSDDTNSYISDDREYDEDYDYNDASDEYTEMEYSEESTESAVSFPDEDDEF